ncbi:hypothetical protein ACGC1H_002082 [Rhizoctonia solani]
MSTQRRSKPKNRQGNNQPRASNPPAFLVAEHNGRKVTILRNPNYRETIASIKRNVNDLQTVPDHQVSVLAFLEEIGDLVQITEDVWPELSSRLMTVRVDVGKDSLSGPSDGPSDGCTGESHQYPSLPPFEYPAARKFHGSLVKDQRRLYSGMQLFVKISSDKTITCEGSSFLTVEGLKQLIEDKADVPVRDQRLIFAGKQLSDGFTLGDYNIQKESTIHMIRGFRGGKPVIYLFPPSPTSNIQVQLSLVQSWTFSELYPPTTITASTKATEALGQTIAWTVNAQPDGTLWDHATEREIAYLFWEALTNPKLPSSPPTTRPTSPVESPSQAFEPANPVLLPSHSALLSFDKVTGYIDDVLLALGLHTEARTSFITYWLPNLSKHAFIALRFLPQNEYEKVAPLSITPAPDVTTRVFMLFRGVEEGQLEQWAEAVDMASRDVTVWRDVVGVDVAQGLNKSLFRVLEWGGMEVK